MQRNADQSGYLTQEAFEELFRKNHKFLCMIALKHVNDAYIAEDIVQEFFINFWERRGEITLHSSFEGYASRAVRNMSISWLRKHEVAVRRANDFDYSESEDPVELANSVAHKDELELRILLLIDRLPPERKRVFLMSTTGNLSYAKIAENLGISINTVKTQMVKAYSFLRSHADDLFMVLIISLLHNFLFFFNF